MSIIRVSAGTTKGYGTKLTFLDGAVKFGYSSHTITAEPYRVSMAQFGEFASANTVKASSNAANLSLQRISVENGISATRFDFLQAYSQAASTNGTMTFQLALYTMSGSTLGTVSSKSISQSHSSGGADVSNTAGYSAQSGTQWRSLGLGTWAMTPGEYFFAFMASIDGPAGSTGSMTAYGASALSIANGALLQSNTANPVNAWAGGIFSAGTASPPATIHISDVVRTGSYALAQPGFRILGSF
jgi:hypothetical protein